MAHWRGARGAWALFAGAGAALVIPASYLVYCGAGPGLWDRAVYRALAYKLGAHSQANHQWATGFVDRSVVGVLSIYLVTPVLAWRRGLPGVALVAQLWAWALIGALASHHFQGYTTKLSTIGPILAVLWAMLEDRRIRYGLAALTVAIAGRGVHYWSNSKSGGYALKSIRLEGLRVNESFRDIDVSVDRLSRLRGGRTAIVSHGVIAYFAAQKVNPTPMPDETYQEVTPSDEGAVLARVKKLRPRLLIGKPSSPFASLRRYEAALTLP